MAVGKLEEARGKPLPMSDMRDASEFFLCNTQQLLELVQALQGPAGECPTCDHRLAVEGMSDTNLERTVTFHCPNPSCPLHHK